MKPLKGYPARSDSRYANYRPDPFHPLGYQLPRSKADLSDADNRKHLLHALEMRRLWLAAAERAAANPHPTISDLGKQALVDILQKLKASRHFKLTHKQRALITQADQNTPCKVGGCGKISHFRFGPTGFCKEHEANYYHARQVWTAYLNKEEMGDSITARYTDIERHQLDLERNRRNNYRRKKRRK